MCGPLNIRQFQGLADNCSQQLAKTYSEEPRVAKPKAKASATKKGRPAAPAKPKIASKQPAADAKKVAAKSSPKKPVAKAAASAKPPTKKIAQPAKKAVTKSTPKAKVSTAKPAASKIIPKKAPAAVVKTVVKPLKKTSPTKAATKAVAAVPVAAKTPAAKPVPAKTASVAVPAKAAAPPRVAKPVASVVATPPAEIKPKIEPAKKAASKPAAKAASPVRKVINLDDIKLPSGYRPSPNEEYMRPQHLAYFRQKLRNWRQELILESQETLEHLRTETRDVGDEAERASRESDNILELRTRDRYRKLLNKIGQALKRIEDGAYGFCEETGEDIGLGRLEARPIATLTVDAQERRELFQRQFRDDH